MPPGDPQPGEFWRPGRDGPEVRIILLLGDRLVYEQDGHHLVGDMLVYDNDPHHPNQRVTEFLLHFEYVRGDEEASDDAGP